MCPNQRPMGERGREAGVHSTIHKEQCPVANVVLRLQSISHNTHKTGTMRWAEADMCTLNTEDWTWCDYVNMFHLALHVYLHVCSYSPNKSTLQHHLHLGGSLILACPTSVIVQNIISKPCSNLKIRVPVWCCLCICRYMLSSLWGVPGLIYHKEFWKIHASTTTLQSM